MFVPLQWHRRTAPDHIPDNTLKVSIGTRELGDPHQATARMEAIRLRRSRISTLQAKEGNELTPGLWQTLRADVYRYRGRSDWRAFVSAYLNEPGFRFTYYLRKVTFYSKKRRTIGIFGYIYNRILLHHYTLKYGYEISPATLIGPGLYIGHLGGIAINQDAILGSNINITKGATIGAASRGPHLGAPTLEDRVWVGTNAIIVGKITIGREALIAPGAYVNFDVPSKAVVLGNPGKIVSTSGSEGYVNRTMEIPPAS
jgi:serine O-acetyltransferase